MSYGCSIFSTVELPLESNVTIQYVNDVPYLLWWRNNLWPTDYLSIDSYIILIERKYRDYNDKTANSVTKFAFGNLDFYNLSSIIDGSNTSHDCMEIYIELVAISKNSTYGSLPDPVLFSERYPSGELHQK